MAPFIFNNQIITFQYYFNAFDIVLTEINEDKQKRKIHTQLVWPNDIQSMPKIWKKCIYTCSGLNEIYMWFRSPYLPYFFNPTLNNYLLLEVKILKNRHVFQILTLFSLLNVLTK